MKKPSPKPFAQPPQQQRSELKRSELLETALQMFSVRGFDAVSVREIADATGSNHAMIRYYFGSKEELWRASVAFLFERLEREVPLPAVDAGQASVELLKQWIRSYIRYCAKHPEHARLMVQEANRDSERLKWMAEKFIRPSHDRMRTWLAGFASTKEWNRGIDPALWFPMVAAMSQGPYLLTEEIRLVHGVDALQESMIDAHCDAVIRLLYP